jgi:hypothetical protein
VNLGLAANPVAVLLISRTQSTTVFIPFVFGTNSTRNALKPYLAVPT